MPLLIVLTDALFLLFYTGVLCAFFKLASEYLQSNCTNQEINNWLSVARCRNGRVAVGMAMLLL